MPKYKDHPMNQPHSSGRAGSLIDQAGDFITIIDARRVSTGELMDVNVQPRLLYVFEAYVLECSTGTGSTR